MKKVPLSKEAKTVYDFLSLLKELSDLEFKAGENRKGIAFKNAHRELSTQPYLEVYDRMIKNSLDVFKGIGKSTSAMAEEFIDTGHIERVEELRLEIASRGTFTVPKSYTIDAVRDVIEDIVAESVLVLTGDARLGYELATLGGTAQRIEFVAPDNIDQDEMYACMNTNGMRILQKSYGVNMDDLYIRSKKYPHPIAIRVYRNNPDQIGVTQMFMTGPERFRNYLVKEAVNQGLDFTPMGIGDGTKHKIFTTRTEEEAFDVLGLGYVPPCLR